MGTSAASLHREAVDRANQGRLAAAERALTRAQALTDDPDLLARIGGTLAVIRARTGHMDEAERLCLDALNTDGISPQTVAILEGQMGAIAEFAGRLDDADSWLSRAIAATVDPIARANMMLNRGLIGMQRRDLDRAADDTSSAAEIFAAAERAIDAAEARHNLGYIDLLRGDIVSALTEMTVAGVTIAGVSRGNAAIGDLDRATVLREAGLTSEAESLLASAAITFRDTRMRKERAEAEFQLARSLLSHDPAQARRVARAAARHFRGFGNDAWGTRSEALAMRAELAAGQVLRNGVTAAPPPGRPPSAEEVDRVARALEQYGFRTEGAALRLSLQLWQARHARVSGRRVRIPRTATMDVRVLHHEVLAAQAAARGRHSDARRHAGSGLDMLFEWQRDFGSLDLQTSLLMHANGLIGAGLTAAVRSGRPDVVFDWSERARHLSFQVAPLRPPPDAALAEDLAELRMLRAEQPDGEGLAGARAEELQSRARERQWASTGAAAVFRRVGLDEAQAELETDTAIVAYVYTGDRLAALVVTADSTKLTYLEDWTRVRALLAGLRADLDMSASIPAGSGFRAMVQRSLDERLAALSHALTDGVLASVGSRRLVLTTPAVLSGIPWAMLPAMRGRTFTLAASVSRWHRLHGAASATASAGFAVGPRVPRGREEVSHAAQAWAAPTVLPAADIAATTRLASEVDVLHVAAHGRHAVDNPLFSGLELSDGTLFGYDIDLIERVPDTVVLSACEVGRSSVRWGEEAIGMTRVWLHAGTRAVVAAPVIVADDAACELLGAMHEGLAAGARPSEALAAASARTGIVAPFQVHGAGF